MKGKRKYHIAPCFLLSYVLSTKVKSSLVKRGGHIPGVVGSSPTFVILYLVVITYFFLESSVIFGSMIFQPFLLIIILLPLLLVKAYRLQVYKTIFLYGAVSFDP